MAVPQIYLIKLNPYLFLHTPIFNTYVTFITQLMEDPTLRSACYYCKLDDVKLKK